MPNRAHLALSEWTERFYLSRDVSPDTIAQVKWAVQSLDTFLERASTVADLCDDLLNRWINWRLAQGRARITVRNQTGALLTIWRGAADAGLTAIEPKRIKRVRVVLGDPDALTVGEVVALIRAAELVSGTIRSTDVPRAALLKSWLMVSWDAGLRPGDACALRTDQVLAGEFIVIQSKTRVPVLCRLREETLQAFLETNPRTRTHAFPLTKKAISYWWSKLRETAGVRGTPKWIRRSGATAVECDTPGSAMGYLGHRTPGLAYKHYVSQRIVQRSKPMPPPLAG